MLVTRHEPLPAHRLGGRTWDVPVIVEYGMPFSADQLQEKVTAAQDELTRLRVGSSRRHTDAG